jgi:hypothetical protein
MNIKVYINVMFFEEIDLDVIVVQNGLAYPSECSPSVLDLPSQRLLPAIK